MCQSSQCSPFLFNHLASSVSEHNPDCRCDLCLHFDAMIDLLPDSDLACDLPLDQLPPMKDDIMLTPNTSLRLDSCPTPNFINDLMQLGNIFGVPTLDRPTVPSLARELLRKKLVESEVAEFSSHIPIDTAPEIESLAALADDLGDILYVVLGTACEYGIPIYSVWNFIQVANMNKLWTEEQALKFIQEQEERGEGGYYTKETDRVYITPFQTMPNSSDPTQVPTDKVCPATTSHQVKKLLVLYNKDGKYLKPPGWKAPDILGLITYYRLRATQSVPINYRSHDAKWYLVSDAQKALKQPMPLYDTFEEAFSAYYKSQPTTPKSQTPSEMGADPSK